MGSDAALKSIAKGHIAKGQTLCGASGAKSVAIGNSVEGEAEFGGEWGDFLSLRDRPFVSGTDPLYF